MAKISLGYKILCDFCKIKEATSKTAFRLTDRETRKQRSIRIGDTCDECMDTLVAKIMEITKEAHDAEREDVHGEQAEQLGGSEGREDLPEDPFKLEEEDGEGCGEPFDPEAT